MIKFEIDVQHMERQIKNAIEKNKFQVGILTDGMAKIAKPKSAGYSTVFGMQVRKIKGGGRITLQRLGQILQKKYNWLRRPFATEKTKKKFVEILAEHIFGDKTGIREKIVELFRKPIRSMKFGSNKLSTIKRKGFNRPLVDTGTFIKNIICKIIKNI
ncbi:MAG: hypothetical protein LBF97_07850 [Elusimicrobiota bacterium]|nr:hypothetical protein [Elusimicrobiota bacterium]